MKILVTGGAGFIGSALVRYLINDTEHSVINVDKLTYAGNLLNVKSVSDDSRYNFEKIDIRDIGALKEIFEQYRPDGVMHLAAESHVDRSIDGPSEFIQTNVVGTSNLLEVSRDYWENLDNSSKETFRFLHVSTDEVYGTLGDIGFFTEETPYQPNSPYSASKASSDHLVRAWFHTYGLPILVTNCSNNYGPFQYPEKLIPVVILKAISGQEIPVYGEGKNIRDWLFVQDHVKALLKVFSKGSIGETYNIGGNNEKQNIEVVETICTILDELHPSKSGKSYNDQITYVKDRPGHDFRYAIDSSKLQNDLGWTPEETFETGIRKTVQWYLDNINWCEAVTENNYSLKRLGTA